ncbi:MAG: hypothetical protein Q7L55_11835 [Actinomycetota bacterium]|nr:hypothetical protein [Actinomycetota bacterium]
MNEGFGPFAVDPGQVAGLEGGLFQTLVNRLLDVECARAGMAGTDLHTSFRATVADRGVDAGVYAAGETEWLPAGDSAWQFKAGDLGPAACASEFESASRAREIVDAGGSYRIVLGKALEDDLIESREKALRDKAAELGYDVSGDRFKVIDGNQLARWVEVHPQLAVSGVLRGIGNVAVAFDKWQQSQAHRPTWVPSTERDELQAAIRTFLADNSKYEMRIEGSSGLGKTRGVLEALRDSPYEPLVLYVGDADDLNYPLIDHLTGQERSAVVVVDECTRQRHIVFAQQLQTGSQIKLITIGERDVRITQALPIELSALPDETIDLILTQSKPTLWQEARRVVVTHCAGNIRWALHLADAILNDQTINVGSLIDENALQILIGNQLSDGDNFLALSALALFTRYGVDREMSFELEQIATGLNIPVGNLVQANEKLERLGLVTRHGRYRSVTPHPVAVFLARHAWNSLDTQILADLLPLIDDDLAEQLLLRAADLGTSGPAATALSRILGPSGPFTSLESIADGRNSRLLIQLAIICPDELCSRLTDLIQRADDTRLRELTSIRRDLVWTLEKLVWHSRTFVAAADLLLRLALAENESWSNNATGTWLALFGALLPATAATPSQRMEYLCAVSADVDAGRRRLAAQGADAAVDIRGGFVTVSGEVQGGVVVEPRGAPQTWDEAWEYVRAAIALLRTMADDPDSVVRETATKSLIDAIHPMLEIVALRDSLFDALTTLPEEQMRGVRISVAHLYALFANVEDPAFKEATNSAPDVTARRAALDVLSARLSPATSSEELAALAYANRWEVGEEELKDAITRAASNLPEDIAVTSILQLLREKEPPNASFELGWALHHLERTDPTVADLAAVAEDGNVAGLVGYLYASMDRGSPDAFDSFLDGAIGRGLDPVTRLVVTVRGPQSRSGWDRVVELLRVLPVHVGAPRLFGWHVGVDESLLIEIIDEWLSKLDTQDDYSFAIDVVAMLVHGRDASGGDLEATLTTLVEKRKTFPDLGQQSWDWVQLARRQLSRDPEALLVILLEQVDTGHLHIYEGSEEQGLIRDAISASGVTSLGKVMGLLQTGSWRLRMDLRGWLADSYPADEVASWIGSDVLRARLVASLTRIAEGPPSDLVTFLLGSFGADDEVTASLYGEFASGSWWGPESDRLSKQIGQLEAWLVEGADPGVQTWARKVIEALKARRLAVLEREDEDGR